MIPSLAPRNAETSPSGCQAEPSSLLPWHFLNVIWFPILPLSTHIRNIIIILSSRTPSPEKRSGGLVGCVFDFNLKLAPDQPLTLSYRNLQHGGILSYTTSSLDPAVKPIHACGLPTRLNHPHISTSSDFSSFQIIKSGVRKHTPQFSVVSAGIWRVSIHFANVFSAHLSSHPYSTFVSVSDFGFRDIIDARLGAARFPLFRRGLTSFENSALTGYSARFCS